MECEMEAEQTAKNESAEIISNENSGAVDKGESDHLQLYPAWPLLEPPSHGRGWPQVAPPPSAHKNKACDEAQK